MVSKSLSYYSFWNKPSEIKEALDKKKLYKVCVISTTFSSTQTLTTSEVGFEENLKSPQRVMFKIWNVRRVKCRILKCPIFETPEIYSSVSRWRPHEVDKHMVLVHTHGLFIT
jgi:hypothetical protein